MNILILNASPKRKGGASRFFSKLMKSMLIGCNITTCDIRGRGDYENALSLLADRDAVIISSPLYVDGFPAHMLPFLIEAEHMCIEKQCQFKLYVVSNSGFVEGKQNATHLKMYEAWCQRAGVQWGGGLGIGGGVMLHVLFTLFPISVMITLIQIMLIALQTGMMSAAELWAHSKGLLIVPFFFSGAFIGIVMMAYAIKRKKTMKNYFTRPLVPSFLFIIFASIFMLISAILNGTWPHKLFQRIGSPPLKSESGAAVLKQ